MSPLAILMLIALLVYGLYFIYTGYRYVRDKRSSIRYSKYLFRKEIVFYTGKTAILHGIATIIPGVYCLCLILIAIAGFISPFIATFAGVLIPGIALLINGILFASGKHLKDEY